MISRERFTDYILQSLDEAVVTYLLGSRQVGKTTLARVIHERAQQKSQEVHYFDLEIPADAQALEQGYAVLASLSGLVIIDEIQRMPALFTILRPLADRIDSIDSTTRFVILGSASPQIVRGVSESLAGRCRTIDISGFRLDELAASDMMRLWLRGGFPRSFLATSDAASMRWRQDFLRSFLERDMPQLGFKIPATTMNRFLMMTAHLHSDIFVASKVGSSMDVSYHTINSYRDILAGTYTLRILQPWYENIGKRLVKQSRVFVRDSGLLHALLHIKDERALRGNPMVGASWEGFVIEQILSICGDYDTYFYRTHAGTELDLLLIRSGKKYGFDIKLSDKVRITKSMRNSMIDLQLEHLYVVYTGERSYAMNERISALPATEVPQLCIEGCL